MENDEIKITGGKFKGNTGKIIGMLSSIGDNADYKVLIPGHEFTIVVNSKHMKANS